ncbi:hypothetical protein ACLOJK_008000 [Asimina triloba]
MVSAPSPVSMRDIEGDNMSPDPVLGLTISEAPSREGIGIDVTGAQGSMPRRNVDLSGVRAPAHHGVLESTFGEACSCLSPEQIFHWPFDMEARTMKILSDLLPVKSREIRECHTLGHTPTLDGEGRGVDEQMLLGYFPDMWKALSELEKRIRLIKGCSSRAEYRYHVLGKRSAPNRFPMGRSHVQDRFGVTSIMDEEERRKIIVVGKHPEEVVVEQVLRPDANVPSKRELLEDTLIKIRGMVRERLEAKRERCRVEEAEKTIAKVYSVLDATRAELEVARDDAEGVSLTKRKTLSGIWRSLRWKLGICICRSSAPWLLFTKRDEAIGRVTTTEEKVLQSSAELVAPIPEAEALCAGEESSLIGEVSRESELLAESETMRAEVTQLRTELEMLRAERLQSIFGVTSINDAWNTSVLTILKVASGSVYGRPRHKLTRVTYRQLLTLLVTEHERDSVVFSILAQVHGSHCVKCVQGCPYG